MFKLELLSYQDLFKKTEDGIIPCTSYRCHEIKTGDAAPVRKQYHRVLCALREEMHGQIGEMKEKEVVSDASIELAALAILIPKNLRIIQRNITVSQISGKETTCKTQA
jgi:hypothetical protein